MRKFQILLVLFCFSCIVKGQKNFAKELQTGMWYQEISSSKKVDNKTMVFKKLNSTISTKEKTIFQSNGTVMRCFAEFESPGGATALSCDSAFRYEIKKDLIHISDKGLLHLYYKMKLITNGVELKTVDPEGFYKK